jgi:hypothetical protein
MSVVNIEYRVMIFGPGLKDRKRGQFHVHDVDCQDCLKYGEGRRFGGDKGSEFGAISRREIVEMVWSDGLGSYPDRTWVNYEREVWFAPCIADLPREHAE